MKRSFTRWNPQRDENEPPIVDAMRKLGASVDRLNGAGIPDLLWGWRGCMGLLEVKMPLGPQGGGPGLNEREQLWWDVWKGPSPEIVRAPAEAIDAINRACQHPDPWNILRVANTAGLAVESSTPIEALHEMKERIIEQTVAISQARIRCEELEAENRELRERIRDLENG